MIEPVDGMRYRYIAYSPIFSHIVPYFPHIQVCCISSKMGSRSLGWWLLTKTAQRSLGSELLRWSFQMQSPLWINQSPKHRIQISPTRVWRMKVKGQPKLSQTLHGSFGVDMLLPPIGERGKGDSRSPSRWVFIHLPFNIIRWYWPFLGKDKTREVNRKNCHAESFGDVRHNSKGDRLSSASWGAPARASKSAPPLRPGLGDFQ